MSVLSISTQTVLISFSSVFLLYMVDDLQSLFSAAYVGLATVAGFVWWFVYYDNGPKLPYGELVSLANPS